MAEKKQIRPSYQAIADVNTPKVPILANCLKAFLVGGAVCLLGEVLKRLFMGGGMTEELAVAAYITVIIALTALLTGIGIYDRAGQFAGAGLAVPISGFANSVSSAMIEFRSEGFVLGLAANAFKLAGCVIVYGSFAAFLLAAIDWLIGVIA